jgi:hypothetical protein
VNQTARNKVDQSSGRTKQTSPRRCVSTFAPESEPSTSQENPRSVKRVSDWRAESEVATGPVTILFFRLCDLFPRQDAHRPALPAKFAP